MIDQTKVNLTESIRNIFDKGVETAFKTYSEQGLIEEHKKKIGYVQAVDQKLEDLSSEEKNQLEAEQNAAESTDETVAESNNAN